jgi:hypothetical protein
MKIASLLIATTMSISCQAADVAPAKPRCTGYASLDGRGNIELNLISTEPTHGGAMLVLDKAHPLYMEVRRHIPDLRPRIWKCIKPWKDKAVFDVDPERRAGERQTPLLTH